MWRVDTDGTVSSRMFHGPGGPMPVAPPVSDNDNHRARYVTRRERYHEVCAMVLACGGRRLVVAYSTGIIRVFNTGMRDDGGDGDVVATHRHHSGLISMLTVHPIDDRVVASGAEDGQVIIWNVDCDGDGDGRVRVLQQFGANDFPDGAMTRDDDADSELRNVTSGRFSPDGRSLIVGDYYGRWFLYSNCAPKLDQRSAPIEQFFATDYNQLVWDLNGYCIDVESQCAPYLTPPGPICSAKGLVYPGQNNVKTNNCSAYSQWYLDAVRQEIVCVEYGDGDDDD